MLKVEAKIFIGSTISPAIGRWVTLPMEKEDLSKVVDALKVGEYIISDYQTELPIEIYEYQSVSEVNEFLHLLKKYEENNKLRLFLSAYLLRDENIDDTIQFLEKGNYRYFENVIDTASLGEAVVRSGGLGMRLAEAEEEETYISKQLKKKNVVDLHEVFRYLDFERIGNDYECSGCRIYPTLESAIMETRLGD